MNTDDYNEFKKSGAYIFNFIVLII